MTGLEAALVEYTQTVFTALIGLGVVGGIAVLGFAFWRARS